MIVEHFNVICFSVLEAKNNPPIGANSYAPKSFFNPFKLVKMKAMNIYILRDFCRI